MNISRNEATGDLSYTKCAKPMVPVKSHMVWAIASVASRRHYACTQGNCFMHGRTGVDCTPPQLAHWSARHELHNPSSVDSFPGHAVRWFRTSSQMFPGQAAIWFPDKLPWGFRTCPEYKKSENNIKNIILYISMYFFYISP